MLLLHLASTLIMVGAIWFIQVVHYPLLNRVGASVFPAYEAAHVCLTVGLLIPVMLLELLTGMVLLWRRPRGLRLTSVWVGLGLLAVIWLSSVWLQVPQHRILATRFDPSAYQMLVISNWIRTIAWNLRGWLVLRMVGQVMS